MPKRTNAFQKLALHMQNQLSPDSDVRESVFLADRYSGEEREIDVVIRKSVAGHDLIISVDCIAHERPATIEWVDRMIGKHQSLPTDVLVLVSESGFTKSAQNKARLANVRAVSIREALDVDWTSIVGKSERLFFARFDFTPTGCTLLLKQDDGATKYSVGPELALASADGKRQGTVMDCARAALHDRKTATDIMDRMTKDGKGEGTFDIAFPDSVLAIDNAGNPHEVLKLEFTFSGTRVTDPIELKHGVWGETPIAYGEGSTGFGKTFLAIEEPAPKVLRGSVTFTDPASREPIVRALNPYRADE